jgi:tumor protein p53-inducible protein 3
MMKYISHADGSLSLKSTEVRAPCRDEIMVKVTASGINRADLLQVAGHYPPPPGASEILGLEISGIVEEVGGEVVAFGKGDRVMGLLAGGGYAEYVTDQQGLFMKIPENIDIIDAAGIPEAFLTAYQGLFELSHLQKQETVLIHAGASGVGTAAIQLAKARGAQVIVTAGSVEKCDFCRELGAQHAIHYKQEDFEEVIKKIGGVDVVIDPIGGHYFPKNINLLNTDGRYVVLAFMGGAQSNIELGKVLSKRIHVMGTTLRARSLDYKQHLIAGFELYFQEKLASGLIKPVIDTVFPVQAVTKAHAFMANNQNIGKLLLSWR